MMSAYSLLTILSICILGKGVLAQLLDERCRRRLGPSNCFSTTPPSYMAFITLNGEHHCGGSLISNRFVLTARHCFIHAGSYSVKLGVQDTRYPQKEQTFGIDKRIPHSDSLIDLMLLKLDREVKYDDDIKPICILLGHPEQALLNRSNDFIITGWGRISNENYEERHWILQRAALKRIEWNDCGRPYGFFCAENPNEFACQGYSGGPLTTYVKHKYETVHAQVGVLHGGEADRCGSFSQYADVVKFTDWIVETITNNTIIQQ